METPTSQKEKIKETGMTLPTFEEYLKLDMRNKTLVRRQQRLLGIKPYHGRQQEGIKYRGFTRPDLSGPQPPRPHLWKSGPDQILHDQFNAWHKHRSQAHYRGEEYTLTYKEYCWLWQDCWHDRGLGSDDKVMTRIDPEKPWCKDNIEIVTRRTVLKRTGERRRLQQL